MESVDGLHCLRRGGLLPEYGILLVDGAMTMVIQLGGTVHRATVSGAIAGARVERSGMKALVFSQ